MSDGEPTGAEEPKALPVIGEEVLVGKHHKAMGLEGETWVMLGEYRYKMGSANVENDQILLACVPERFGGANNLIQQIKDGRFEPIERAEDYVKIKRAVRDEFGGAYIGCDREGFFAMQDRAKDELEQQAQELEATVARIREKIGGNQ